MLSRVRRRFLRQQSNGTTLAFLTPAAGQLIQVHPSGFVSEADNIACTDHSDNYCRLIRAASAINLTASIGTSPTAVTNPVSKLRLKAFMAPILE